MDKIDLCQTNQAYIERLEQQNISCPINQKQINDENKKDDKKKLTYALAGLAVMGAVIAAGVAIYKNKDVSKVVDNASSQAKKLLKDVNFKNGIATLDDNTKFTGIIEDTLKNGDKITLEYVDGALKKSSRNGSKTFEKAFETLKNGTHKVTTTKNGTTNSVIIEDLQKAAKDSQAELKALLKEKDNLSIEEFQKKADAIKYKSKNNENEIQSIVKDKQKILDEQKAAAEKAAKEAQEKAAKEAEEKAARLEAERIAQEARQKALVEFRAQKESEFADFSASLEGKSKEELDELKKQLKPERTRLTQISTENIKAAGKYSDGCCINPEYLHGEDEISYEILRKKENLISAKQIELENNFLNKALRISGDRPVNTANSFSYLTNDERNAFLVYYDAYPENISMREAKGEYCSKLTNLMDSGFRKAPALEEDAVVYRAVAPMQFLRQEESKAFIDSIEAGKTIKDYAYMSTATQPTDEQFKLFANTAIENEGGVLMRIHLPKGTKGVLGGHREYLLPRNSKIKILSTKVIDGTKVADCEYILPS